MMTSYISPADVAGYTVGALSFEAGGRKAGLRNGLGAAAYVIGMAVDTAINGLAKLGAPYAPKTIGPATHLVPVAVGLSLWAFFTYKLTQQTELLLISREPRQHTETVIETQTAPESKRAHPDFTLGREVESGVNDRVEEIKRQIPSLGAATSTTSVIQNTVAPTPATLTPMKFANSVATGTGIAFVAFCILSRIADLS